MPARKIDGWWYADFYVLEKRYRMRSPQNTAPAARAYENYLRGEIAKMGSLDHLDPKNRPKDKPVLTFAKFVDRWLVDYVEVNNKWSEQMSKRKKLRGRLLPYFGTMPLPDITTSRIDQFVAGMKREGLSNKSINNHLTILRKCLVTAVAWEELTKVPSFEFLKYEPPEIDARTSTEIASLLAACSPMPWRAFVLTKVRTGLRFNEIIALEWQDLDLDQALLSVRRGEVDGHVGTPKTRRSTRTIPLTSEVVETLRSLPRVGARVFTHHGRSITHWTAWYHIKKACVRAGIRHTSWHRLRHTFATELFSRGASPKAVQDLMGHEKIEMTMRYTHLPTDVLRRTISLLEPQTGQAWAGYGQEA